MDLQEFDFSVIHRAGRLHNNADALSCLVQTNSQEHTMCIKNMQQPALVSTICVKLSGGRTAIVKLESSKPLIIDPDATLVNIYDQNHGAVPRPPQEAGQVNTITLSPIINLGDSQRNDPHLPFLIDMKIRKLPKPNLKQIKDPALKSWLRHYDQYFLHDEILYRALGNRSNFHPQHVILIPSGLQAKILKTPHDGPLGGHLGITRTEEPENKHIQLCKVCNHKNSPLNSNPAPLGHITVSQPFTFWAMDYMGPLPETSCGNKHILVIVDHFTKWCEAFATPDQKDSTVALILVSRIFSWFGTPAVLHSDQG